MQLRFLSNVMPPREGVCKVTALTWCPNNKRFAVVTADRIVHLFDETGQHRDKFSTKPADKQGPKSYLVTGMAFSPDSTKLAIAQSDNILFIYKLGLEWGDKKTICNKYPQSSPVTCVTWPAEHPNEVVFGLAEGKVKIGLLKEQKPAATLYATGSLVTSICSSPDGNAVVSAHQDGTMYRFLFQDHAGRPSYARFAVHSCVPTCVSWGASVVAAGVDGKVSFYDNEGALQRTFDYSTDPTVKEFSSCAFNPTGECCVVGNFNRFFVFVRNARAGVWEEAGDKVVENYYTVSALAWKPDGSRLCVGALCGVVDMFDACIRRARYQGKFEFTYVSHSQVIVKRLAEGTRIVLKSHYGCEVQKINIFQDRYLVAHTPETMLLGDLETCKLSEIPWAGGGKEKFFLDNPSVCMVYSAGELSLVEYGRNELLGSCRTEHMNPHLISVRINERPPRLHRDPELGTPLPHLSATGDNKKIAYLLDLLTIRVLDLVTGITAATISHDAKVDWLELNARADLLLFRDKRRQLHLFDLMRQTRTTLLTFCNYVQWVPESDVVVAQNRGSLCVWYNISAPDKMTVYPIKGDVEEIERSDGRTEVIVDEGMNTASYMLDEALIGFGTAVDDGDFDKAIRVLEGLELTSETRAMWSTLFSMALAEDNVPVAQRAATALGDVATARALQRVGKLAREAAASFGGNGYSHWTVRARLAELRRDFRTAEILFLEHGQAEEAISMYQQLQRWEEAIRVADTVGHPQAGAMRENYFAYLMESGQEGKAAEQVEREGRLDEAVRLYITANMPARAARLIAATPHAFGADVMESVSAALAAAGMHDRAGELLERLGQSERALEAYLRGNAFRRAVELARRVYPAQVVKLEEQWGDWLCAQKQLDAAINHYIEAGVTGKSIEAALSSRQWNKAIQLLDSTLQSQEQARPYYRRIAQHFEESNDLKRAERFLVKAGCAQEAVAMYTRHNRWPEAYALATSCMSEAEVASLYISQAQRLEAQGRMKEAEKLFLTVGEPDLAISMYKKARKFDDMVRLVREHRKELLLQTHERLAQQLEMEGALRDAERHYAEAGKWAAAVTMYCGGGAWEEAMRVARYYGGQEAAEEVGYKWALALGGEAGSKLLTKLGLVEKAIDYAIQSRSFDHAFELARTSLKSKLPHVHLKLAMQLEDEERFAEAEEHYLKAGKPREAVEMHLHQHDWAAAVRVAEQADPASIPDVLLAQGDAALERKDLPRAEQLFVAGKQPERAVQMYQQAGRWEEAVRVAKRHAPHRLAELNAARQQSLAGGGATHAEIVGAARMWEETGEHGRAIDAYLSVTEEHTRDADALEEAWESAVKLASLHQKARYVEVTAEVARRLAALGKHRAAAELFKDVEAYKEAVDSFIRAGAWAEAKQVVDSVAPQYREHVERQYKQHLMRSEAATELVHTGSVSAGLDMLVQRQEWGTLLRLLEQQPPDVAARYAVTYAERVAAEAPADALRALLRFGAPPAAEHFPAYVALALRVLGAVGAAGAPDALPADLRTLLYRLLSAVRAPGDRAHPAHAQLSRLLLAAHYLALRQACTDKGLHELRARLSVALLRHADLVPADRAFYQAGADARRVGWRPLAFLIWNRFLDLSEALEEGDVRALENTDFARTDVPVPDKYRVDAGVTVPKELREEVNDTVIGWGIGDEVEQELPRRACDGCGQAVYAASLHCGHCAHAAAACIVSGYPVIRSQQVQCTKCSSVADRNAWNQWVAACKTCPWCGSMQGPMY